MLIAVCQNRSMTSVDLSLTVFILGNNVLEVLLELIVVAVLVVVVKMASLLVLVMMVVLDVLVATVSSCFMNMTNRNVKV